MGRSPCCEKSHTNKGAWSKDEDQRLVDYIRARGEGCWRSLPKSAGLLRCGKSCRLRWINYLRPDLKRGNFTDEEDELIIKLHTYVGNKWSLIASRLPGRTDNEIKNHWNTHVKRKLISRGLDPQARRPLISTATAPVTDPEIQKCVNQSLGEPVLTSEPKATPAEFVQDERSNSGATIETQAAVTERERSSGLVDLELSIGLGPFRSRSSWSSCKPNGSHSRTTKGVCLCWQLGFQAIDRFCTKCKPIKNRVVQANATVQSISYNNNNANFLYRIDNNCGPFFLV